MIVPAFDGARPDRLLGIGLNMYDVMAVDRLRRSPLGRRRTRDRNLDGSEDWSPARHRVIDGAEVSELLPALAPRDPSGGYLFYDCQTDDVRLVLTVLGEAERFGAVFANGLEVTGLVEQDGRARGAHVRDAESGEAFPVRAQAVVNATGVWADRIRPGELHDEAEVPVIRPSRGTHIILPSERLPVNVGAIVPAADGRTIFVLPWLGQTLIGTTDNDYDGDIDHVQPGRGGRRVPARGHERVLRHRARPRATSRGAYAGVRPLISTGDPKKSVDISRKAELYETSSGMVTITGGKLTTWRRMAKMTVDRLVERDGRDAPCRTGEIPLGMPVAALDLPRVEGVGEDAYEQLAGRYGYAAHEVLAVARRARRARPADPARHARPAGRGGVLRPPRAGAQRRRRAAAAHAPRADRRARPAGRRASRRRSASRGRSAPSSAGTRRAARGRPSASAPRPPRRAWWSAPGLPSGPRRNFPPFRRLHRPD